MNDDFNQSLSSSFSALDADIAPPSDWDDLSSRIEARHRRHRRGLTGCAVLVAMLTGAGGFLVGHNTDSSMTLSPGAARSASAKDAAPSSAASGADDATASARGNESPLSPNISGLQSTDAPLISPGLMRTTPTGIQIRSWKQGLAPQRIIGSEFVDGACISVGFLQIGLVTDDDVVETSVALTERTTPEATAIGRSGMSGKVVMLIAVTSTDAARISVRFPNGETDSMAPVNGLALFAIKAGRSDFDRWASTKLTATAADGTTTNLPLNNGGMPYASISNTPSGPVLDCTPHLPPAGEQPQDPAAERAAVEQVFATIYDSATSEDAKTGLVDDTTGLTQAYEAARTGPFAAATKNTKFVLHDLVFTSPTEAVLKYDITIPPGSGSQEVALNRFGRAKFIDGKWKATRATVCSDLALAGASCDYLPNVPRGPDAATSSGSSSGLAPSTVVPAAATPGGH